MARRALALIPFANIGSADYISKHAKGHTMSSAIDIDAVLGGMADAPIYGSGNYMTGEYSHVVATRSGWKSHCALALTWKQPAHPGGQPVLTLACS